MTKELPIVVANMFHASVDRENTYIAGISMGGYGALKLAMTCPEIYGHAASMSGALNIPLTMEYVGDMFSVGNFCENISDIFGDTQEFYGSENDICYLANQVQKRNELQNLRFYICCGTEDPLWPVHCEIKNYLLAKTNLDIRYDARRGSHNWDFWNEGK